MLFLKLIPANSLSFKNKYLPLRANLKKIYLII